MRSRPPEVGATDATAGSAGARPGASPADDVGPEAPGQGLGTGGRPVSEPIADPAAGPTHTTSSWWDSTTGPAAAASGTGATGCGPICRRGRAMGRRRSSGVRREPPPDLGRAAEDIVRALTDERLGGVRGRVARAVIGWLPIAFGIGWIVGRAHRLRSIRGDLRRVRRSAGDDPPGRGPGPAAGRPGRCLDRHDGRAGAVRARRSSPRSSCRRPVPRRMATRAGPPSGPCCWSPGSSAWRSR